MQESDTSNQSIAHGSEAGCCVIAARKDLERARLLAERLDLPLHLFDGRPEAYSALETTPAATREAEESGQPAGTGCRFHLFYNPHGALALCQPSDKAAGTVSVEFDQGKMYYRRKQVLQKEMLVKAMGRRFTGGSTPTVFDATAGLGQDAFILAAAGYQVVMMEDAAVVHALLEDGLQRALRGSDEELRRIVQRMELHRGDSLQGLEAMPQADVVYLDPMFPQRRKSARVKKNMYLLQQLHAGKSQHDAAGLADDELPAQRLLEKALQHARHRVVVKRPRLAPSLAQRKPDSQLSGKTSRFDIYLCSN